VSLAVTRIIPLRLALATLVAGLGAIAPVSASCQTERCRESAYRHELEYLAQLEKDAADSDDPAVWRRFIDELTGELSAWRGIASYEARFRWELPLILADPAAAQAEHDRRLTYWRERWRARFPESAEPWCSGAQRAPDLDAAIRVLDEAATNGADADGIADCRAEIRFSRGESAAVVAELEAAIAVDPEDVRLHDRLVSVLASDWKREYSAARAAAIERRARHFRTDAEAQEALVQSLISNGEKDEASALVLELLDEGFDGRELRRICRSDLPATIRLACLEARLADTPREGSEEAIWEYDDLQQEILAAAIAAGEISRAEDALRRIRPLNLVSVWTEIVAAGKLAPELCSALRDDLRERIEVPTPETPHAFRSYLSLLEPLSACEGEVDLLTILDRLDPEGSSETPEQRLSRLHARSTSMYDGLERYRAMLASPPATRLPKLVGLARQHPEKAMYAVDVARAHDLLKDVTASATWYEEAIRREPAKEPDLRIKKSELYLRHGDLAGARREALAVAVLRNSSPRNRAEADYFLGRVERLEGAVDSAITRFESYFLLRQTYDLCFGCDRPLLFQLFERSDRARLARYLNRRRDAIAQFESRSPAPCGSNRLYARFCPSMHESAELALAVVGGCRFLDLEEAKLSPSSGGDSVLLPGCPEAWSDRSRWFRDDQVLRVYDDLMDVD
jgi:hypothetical protein